MTVYLNIVLRCVYLLKLLLELFNIIDCLIHKWINVLEFDVGLRGKFKHTIRLVLIEIVYFVLKLIF